MLDLDKILKDIEVIRKSILPQLKKLDNLYTKLKEELNDKFKEEYREQRGDLRGLEDFYSLLVAVKKDVMVVKGTTNLIKKLNNLSEYNVSEESIEEAKEEAELEEIFDKTKK
jgi:hypothetical protein